MDLPSLLRGNLFQGGPEYGLQTALRLHYYENGYSSRAIGKLDGIRRRLATGYTVAIEKL